MTSDLTPLLDHDLSDDCPVCRPQDVIQIALLPAAAAWELNNELPRFSIALHGAAELLGAMLLVPAPDYPESRLRASRTAAGLRRGVLLPTVLPEFVNGQRRGARTPPTKLF